MLRPALALAAALSALLFCQPAFSDDWDSEPATPSGGGFADRGPTHSNENDGFGALFRAGHIEGQGVPQVRPITPFELFPYILSDDQLFFSDLRAFPTNDGTFGGNAGFGYRYYHSDWDRIFGLSGWYDADYTRDVYFQQLGLSFESYAMWLDVRGNFYLPIGATERQYNLAPIAGTSRFSGDNIIFDQRRSFYAAMKGFDMEAGIPIPGDIAEGMGLRLYGGGYHFVDDAGNTITGGSARLQANLIAGLDAQVQVMHDAFYETRAFVGISWTFGPIHRSKMDQKTAYGRIGEHVTRNYTVLAPARHQIEETTAINPNTQAPYTIAHVSSAAAAGGSGAVGNPFQTIAAGQAAGRDIVFVHAGSVFSGADANLVLNAGDRIYGDGAGVSHYIRVPELGTILMPHGPTGGSRPLLSGAPGDSIVLASNSEIAGFSVANAGGNAVFGSGVSNAIVRNLLIDSPTGAGMRFVNSSGLITLLDNRITNSGGNGIAIDGGTGQFDFQGTTTVSGANAAAVSIRNLAAGGSARFNDLAIDTRKDRGLDIDNVAGSVVVAGTTTISNAAGSTASALQITNSSGTFGFNRVDITDATGAAAVNLQQNTGSTSFNTLNIASKNATALFADTAGLLTINPFKTDGTVDGTIGGTIAAVAGTAIDIKNTNLAVNLTSVSSNDAPVGIKLVGTGGIFAVHGNGTTGSGGLIQSTGTAIYLQNTGPVGLRWMNLDSNGLGIRADNVSQFGLERSIVTKSTTYGIDALNTTTFSVLNSNFLENGGANIRGVFDQQRSYAWSINGTQLISSTSDNVVLAVMAGGEGSTMNLQTQGNLVQNSQAATNGFNINWNGNLSVTVDQTHFDSSGANNTGLLVTNASATGLTSVAFTNSVFFGTASGNTVMRLTSAGPAQVNLVANQVEFDATNGIGFRMALGASSSVNANQNTIVDTTDGGTGFLFDSILGPGNVTMQNNMISLQNAGGLLDRGIIFSSVTDTINLFGTNDNIIAGADTAFFAPAGTTVGGILINGSRLP